MLPTWDCAAALCVPWPARPTHCCPHGLPSSPLLALDLAFPSPCGESPVPYVQIRALVWTWLLQRRRLLLGYSMDPRCPREARWMFAEKQGEMGRKSVKSRQDFTQKNVPHGSGWTGWRKAVLATEAVLGKGQ